MATWRPDDGMGPPQKVLEIIVDYMRRVARPSYLGFISLEIRWSLSRTKQALDKLVDQGLVKELTDDEKVQLRLPVTAALYVLGDGKKSD